MCGIVGYAGDRQAAPILLDALTRLEYRGYDSAGIAVLSGGKIDVRKSHGRLKVLKDAVHDGADVSGTLGVGHTRWATHGEPTDVNAHPHLSKSGRVALVHNGIIENYASLRSFLTDHGYSFISDTDTEVIVQLVDYLYKGDPLAAVLGAVKLLEGSWALGVVFADHPDTIIAARKDSPLIIGLGQGENYIASDIPAVLSRTRDIIRLGERELAVVTKSSVSLCDRYGESVQRAPEHVDWDADAAEKGGWPHFMLKEIMEQPDVIKQASGPRIRNGGVELELKKLDGAFARRVDRVYVTACGSAYHVGMVGRFYLMKYARLPVFVELASEFRYSDPVITENTLVIVISQSGETLDTLKALREAKARGAMTLAVVNVMGSSIASEADDTLYTYAGPEIAVATTKAYTAQLVVMQLIALKLGVWRGLIGGDVVSGALADMEAAPELLKKLLGQVAPIQQLAAQFINCRDIFFMGRSLDYALALEGSLKLKEISYIHSEAYAAGELKHGTISLIENGTLVIALCTYAPLREKMHGNIREVKSRGAVVIAVTGEDDTQAAAIADHVIYLPSCSLTELPMLSVAPLQLFAYYTALLRGCDIDKPRNLAKSVTVE